MHLSFLIWRIWPCACSIADGEAKLVEGELSKSLLENYKCYLWDFRAEVIVRVGRVTQVEEWKAECQAAEVMLLQVPSFLHMLVWSEVINVTNMFRSFSQVKKGRNLQGLPELFKVMRHIRLSPTLILGHQDLLLTVLTKEEEKLQVDIISSHLEFGLAFFTDHS